MTTPTMDAVPAGDANPEDGWQRPSPRLRGMRQAQVAVVTGLVTLVAALLTGFAIGPPEAAIAAAAAVAAGLIGLWFALRRVRAWSYLERHDDLLVRRGVFVTRLSVVPYGRMQFVDVAAGPIERVFGLATVHMHTAAAASDARIPGLERADAARLRDQLAALGEAKAAGL